MARNWVEFDEGPKVAGPNTIYVSMNKDGEILMNRHTFEAMRQPASVVMLFDPETDTVGLRPASPLTPNAFPIRKKGKHGNRQVSVRRFAEKHEIRLDSTVRFLTATIEDQVLVLDLRRMSNVSRKYNGRTRR